MLIHKLTLQEYLFEEGHVSMELYTDLCKFDDKTVMEMLRTVWDVKLDMIVRQYNAYCRQ